MSNSANKQNGRTGLRFEKRAMLTVSTAMLALGATFGLVAQASSTSATVRHQTIRVSTVPTTWAMSITERRGPTKVTPWIAREVSSTPRTAWAMSITERRGPKKVTPWIAREVSPKR